MKLLLAFTVCSALSIPFSAFAQGPVRQAHVPILIYHSVRPYYPGITDLVKEFTVPPDIFDDQMKYLRDNGYTVITLNALMQYLNNGTPLPSKPVMITLDDGWENQYLYAFPILEKYHYPAVFYVYPNAIGTKHFLTYPELRTMIAHGMSIEDHTQSHPELPKITDPSTLDTELEGSKLTLEKNLNVQIQDFAYPFGEFNAQDLAEVARDGYRSARTVHSGVEEDSNLPYTMDGIIITGDFNRFVHWVNRS